jgi:hypothetical protein
MPDEKDIHDWMEMKMTAWLESQRMDETQDYLSRGRQLSKLSAEELGQRWVGAFKAYVGQGDMSRRRELEDLDAEHSLRKLEPPYRLVKADIMKKAEGLSREGEIDEDALNRDFWKFVEDTEERSN